MKSKIIYAVLVALLVAFIFTGCIRSEEAKAVDELISSIGQVDLNSDAKISEVENAVDALSEKDRKSLRNLDDLKNARSEYNELVADVVESKIEKLINHDNANLTPTEKDINSVIDDYEALPEHIKPLVDNYSELLELKEDVTNKAAKDIDNQIATIGEVTIHSESAIVSARTLFDSASDDVKSKVLNLGLLEAAEKAYKEAVEKSHADVTITLINAIEKVTIDSKDTISKARDSYDDLTANEKTYVTNLDVLIDAETEFSKIKATARANALSVLKSSYDEFEGITWYEAQVHPRYINQRSFVLPYIGSRTSGETGWLRLKLNYYGDDWIFFEKASFNIDGKYYTKLFSYFSDITRDNDSGDVWETADIAPTANDIAMLWEIVNSTKTIVRFQGDDYHYDLTIKQSDKEAIRQVLTAYELMN